MYLSCSAACRWSSLNLNSSTLRESKMKAQTLQSLWSGHGSCQGYSSSSQALKEGAKNWVRTILSALLCTSQHLKNSFMQKLRFSSFLKEWISPSWIFVDFSCSIPFSSLTSLQNQVQRGKADLCMDSWVFSFSFRLLFLSDCIKSPSAFMKILFL